MFINLHRHTMYSTFDGCGRPDKAVEYAKEMGQTALAITDHGNMYGVVDHYHACLDNDIKPILGCEVYFQPSFNADKPRYHLSLLAKNNNGYKNLCKVVSEANRDNFYRYPIVTFETLERYGKDLVCMSGCVGGILAQMAIKDVDQAKIVKTAKKFKKLFDGDFFIEVMPLDIEDQIKANNILIDVAEQARVKVVMTFDSHYIRKEDYDTYLVMHQIGKSKFDYDYSERFMPTEKEVIKLWKRNYKQDPRPFIAQTQKIADMCDVHFDFKEMVPKIDWGVPSDKKLRMLAVESLKKMGKTSIEYRKRLKRELGVIAEKKFEDYFLLVYDIVKYAREQGIKIGPGRGSVCGSLLAYAIGLTDIDPIIFDTQFERFLRPDRVTFPDIDTDFDSSRRGEVINYILKKYEGNVAPICTFGYYRVKNLVNDIGRIMEMDAPTIAEAKKAMATMIGEDEKVTLEEDDLRRNKSLREIDRNHKGFLKHFSKLYGQTRFIGTHAAGIVITAEDITNYLPLARVRGNLVSSYDLGSLDKIKVVKIDVLGLATMAIVNEIEELTGESVSYDMLDDKELYEAFCEGDTVGVFQFEKEGAKQVLAKVVPDNFDDLVAVTALNRPAPLQLGIVDDFVDGKNGNVDEDSIWYPYTKDAYGNIIYQEHVMKICRELAKMEWQYVEKTAKKPVGKVKDQMREMFVEGAVNNGVGEQDAIELFDKMTLYLFNKSHGVGYTFLSLYLMQLKIKHPLEFFYATLKHTEKSQMAAAYKSDAIKKGIIFLLPHVNGRAKYSITKLDGDKVIQEGMSTIKGIGVKTAEKIESGAPYKNKQDFLSRSGVGPSIVKMLESAGALEFDMKVFMNRVVRYNSSLYGKNLKVW